jgi:hypothetical protein
MASTDLPLLQSTPETTKNATIEIIKSGKNAIPTISNYLSSDNSGRIPQIKHLCNWVIILEWQ